MIEIAPKEYEFEMKSYDEAKLFCFSLNVDGKVGWRLPTKDELKVIYERDNDFLLKTSAGYPPFYLSSSVHVIDGTYLLSFGDGSGDYFHEAWLFDFLVRPVRDLKDD